MGFKEKIGVKGLINKLLNPFCGYYIGVLTLDKVKTLVRATSPEVFFHAFAYAQAKYINKF